MQEPYKYIITAGTLQREVYPLEVRTLIENFSFNESDKKFAFDDSYTGKLVFDNAYGDYSFLHDLESSGNKCHNLSLEIQRRCGGVYSTWRTCNLRLIDGEWDIDRCEVMIAPKIVTEYTCIDDKGDDEVNILGLPLQKQLVQYLIGTIEKKNYSSATYAIDDKSQFDGNTPDAMGWKCYSVVYDPNDKLYHFFYAREVFNGSKPGYDFVNIGGDDWARFPVLIPIDSTDTTTAGNSSNLPAIIQAKNEILGITATSATFIFNYLVFGDSVPGYFDNGRLLSEILTNLLSTNCSLTIVSNFLQLNPDATFEATYPLFTPGLTYNLMLFVKSDVKRPFDSNLSTNIDINDNSIAVPTTLKEIIVNLCTAYNLNWKIINGALRIEHISWFERSVTLDMTVKPYFNSLLFTRKYTYKADALPRYETFTFMEALHTDFVGKAIEYVGDCVTDNKSAQKKETPIPNWTTDIVACLEHGTANDSLISDDGFVLMACTLTAGVYYPISVAPVLDTKAYSNNCLGWAFLHAEYFRHERLQLNGYLNGTYQTFLTVKPIKKRIALFMKWCCDDTLTLTDLVHTEMGDAQIESAAYKNYNDELTLTLLYPDTTPAVACLQPVSFTYVRRDGELFTFNTQFITADNYHTEIEATLPDGSVVIFTIDPDSNGEAPADFGILQYGTYKFRKRVICSVDSSSPWTDYITVVTIRDNIGINNNFSAGSNMTVRINDVQVWAGFVAANATTSFYAVVPDGCKVEIDYPDMIPNGCTLYITAPPKQPDVKAPHYAVFNSVTITTNFLLNIS